MYDAIGAYATPSVSAREDRAATAAIMMITGMQLLAQQDMDVVVKSPITSRRSGAIFAGTGVVLRKSIYRVINNLRVSAKWGFSRGESLERGLGPRPSVLPPC